MGTTELSDASEDLAFLRARPDRYGAFLMGRLMGYNTICDESSYSNDPIVGAKVFLQGSSGLIEATTANDGNFQFTGLAEGTYRIWCAPPVNRCFGCLDQADFDTQPWTVRVTKEACMRLDLMRLFTGVIEGVVTGYQPQDKDEVLYVEAVPVAGKDEKREARVGDGGAFRIEELRPGQYLLGVNIQGAPETWKPFKPWYFPGTENSDEARVVDIGEWEQLKGITLPRPPGLTLTKMQVEVCLANGRAASGYGIEFYHQGDRWASLERLDLDGRRTIPCLQGEVYRAKIHWDNLAGRSVASKPVTITCDGSGPLVQIVLGQ
jgi:hypothetical protein